MNEQIHDHHHEMLVRALTTAETVEQDGWEMQLEEGGTVLLRRGGVVARVAIVRADPGMWVEKNDQNVTITVTGSAKDSERRRYPPVLPPMKELPVEG